MGFKGTRGPLIIFVIVIIAVIAVIALASQGPPKTKAGQTDIITVTIEKSVGIDRVVYENINNPGEGKTLTIISLPYSFNCSKGDTLYFQVSTRTGYQWDTWDFNPVGRSNTDNPLWITSDDPLYCYKGLISMTPSCIPLRVSPTASPNPTVTPQPTVTPTPSPSPTPDWSP